MKWGKYMAQIVRNSDKYRGDFFTSDSKLECGIWKSGVMTGFKAAGIESQFIVEVKEIKIGNTFAEES